MTFEEWIKDERPKKFTKYCMREAWNASAKAHKPMWIPVTERLPDKMGFYPALKDNKSFWEYFNGGDFENYKVTHWLELPELPE